jgi:hypothetical protein
MDQRTEPDDEIVTNDVSVDLLELYLDRVRSRLNL